MSLEQWSKYAWLDEARTSDDLMAGCLGVAIGDGRDVCPTAARGR